MITVWAAIESMAARLAAVRTTEADLAGLRALVDAFRDDPSAQLTEYSRANMAFHTAIIRLGGIALMTSLTETLFIHMRAVRAVTMTQDNRAQRSIADHRAIIAALGARDADRRAPGCASTRWASPRMSRNTAISSTHRYNRRQKNVAGAPPDAGKGKGTQPCPQHSSRLSANPKSEMSESEMTDGFHLVIDALKLNGIKTIYDVPGIPITALGRLAQAAGIRVISFRHEQNAGNAAAIAGFLTKSPGVCLTVSAPGFLNGLIALGQCDDELLSDDPDQRLVRTRDRRPAARRLRRNGPLRRCQNAVQGGSACCTRPTSASVSRAPSAPRCRPAGRRLSRPASKTVRPGDGGQAGRRSLVKVIDPAPARASRHNKPPSSVRSTCYAARNVR